MKSAGLTHGGFYGYFKSKDDLIAQSLAKLLGSAETLPADLATCAKQYLSPDHRDNFADGCPFAALASETIRKSNGGRAEMTEGLKLKIEQLTQLATGAGEARKRRAAIGSWAAMVGALILARMSDDSGLSEEILSETQAWLATQARRDSSELKAKTTAKSAPHRMATSHGGKHVFKGQK
jgi:TetR/AcrR family transcriptional repressor of nem operon